MAGDWWVDVLINLPISKEFLLILSRLVYGRVQGSSGDALSFIPFEPPDEAFE